MSTWTKGAIPAVVAGFLLTVAGCSEPDQLVPAVPPGIDGRAALAEKAEEKPSEALGEQAAGTGGAVKAPRLTDAPPAPPTAKGEVKTTRSGVKYETLKEGTGAIAKAGQRIKIHYLGKLEDGRKFDSSYDRGEPSMFMIGTGDVISGWDEAVPGMRIGEKRKLTVPPNAAYGAQGRPGIPPNATLIFEVELVNVQ